MSNLPLQFSEFGKQELKNQIKKSKKNRTYKNHDMKQNVKKFLQTMEGFSNDDDDLVDFAPNKTQKMHTVPIPPPNPSVAASKEVSDDSIDNAAQLGTNLNASSYYKQFVPYYTNLSNEQTGQRDELLEKLNYMIHLLEDQQDEKTSTVTEELILYLFLGVFVIFTVDSFARAAKYTR
jgi:hypothetical protein